MSEYIGRAGQRLSLPEGIELEYSEYLAYRYCAATMGIESFVGQRQDTL
jgi:hypothetical protein